MKKSKQLTNRTIRFQVMVERFKSFQVKRDAARFEKMVGDLTNELNPLHWPQRLTRRDLGAMVTALEKVIEKHSKVRKAQLRQDLVGIVDSSIANERAVFKLAKLAFNSPKVKDVRNSVWAQPLTVGTHLDPFIDEWTTKEKKIVSQAVRGGFANGLTTPEIVKSVVGTKKLGYRDARISAGIREAKTVIHTSVQHVANTARIQVWDANSDVVERYKILATLDGRTSEVCRAQDGQEYELHRGPVPPLHPNCRSTTIAVLDPALDLDFLDEDATRASSDGQVSSNTTYYEWLKTQDSKFIQETLGKGKAKLFESMSAEEFRKLSLDKYFEPLTLAEMKEKI